MKKVLIILAFLALPFLAIGQEINAVNTNTNTVETIIEKTILGKDIKKETATSSKMKAKVLKINKKKSTEIISIKAYRKSLQIKVKTIKLC
ncbi:hypothetical protein [Psychroserpens damuponensis]|uniref:hypothetical protein n=1 Tax=Psychroserpens damuponensis TaxID=943936 RepID=UPI00058E34B4|nr:hypothetical protein [Psychroserpens damuponensis]